MPRFNLRAPRFSTLGLLEGIAAANAEEAQDIQNQNNLALLQQRNLNNNILEATGLDIALADLATTQATQTITEAQAAEAPALAQATTNAQVQLGNQRRNSGLLSAAQTTQVPLTARAEREVLSARAGAQRQAGNASSALVTLRNNQAGEVSANAQAQRRADIARAGASGAQARLANVRADEVPANAQAQRRADNARGASAVASALSSNANARNRNLTAQELQLEQACRNGSTTACDAIRRLAVARRAPTTDEGSAFDNSVSNTAGSF